MVEFQSQDDTDRLTALSEDVPVVMPELPLSLVINTPQQFKAVSDPIRSRILGIIQQRPATAKQVADALKITPGAAGHHLHVLESAGLAQVVARRIIRGIIASYYTRTARIFDFEFPADVRGEQSVTLKFVNDLREEMLETLTEKGEDGITSSAFPHTRLSPERVKVYRQRLNAIVRDLIAEQPDPQGQVYGLFTALFESPGYLQGDSTLEPNSESILEEESQ